jgi:AraC family transcriptional regulator
MSAFVSPAPAADTGASGSRGRMIPPNADERGHTSRSADASGLLEYIGRAVDQNPDGARAAAVQLLALLTRPSTAEFQGARGGLAPGQRRKVDRYMRENLERPLRVRELADHVQLSASHFCRAFKDSFGSAPHMHIMRLRVELAQRLMLTTEDQLTQIALACGMADQAHLSKLFRREVGETPSAWRRRNLRTLESQGRGQRAQATRNASRLTAARASGAPQWT